MKTRAIVLALFAILAFAPVVSAAQSGTIATAPNPSAIGEHVTVSGTLTTSGPNDDCYVRLVGPGFYGALYGSDCTTFSFEISMWYAGEVEVALISGNDARHHGIFGADPVAVVTQTVQ